MSRLLLEARLLGPDQGYPEFAQALARLVREGNELGTYWDPRRCLGAPLGTPETRAVLQAELTDPDGNPRLSVAEVLSWAHRRAETLESWQQFVDGKVAAEGASADIKAQWLRIRAHAESMEDTQVPPRAIKGKVFLEQALETAASADVKLEILRELAMAYAQAEMYDDGLAYLESVADQFETDEAVAALEALRQQLRHRKAAWVEKELANARGDAERMEAKAREAALAGDEKLQKIYERFAEADRQRERKLLEMME